MNKTAKIVLGVVAVGLVVGGAAFLQTGGLQGRIMSKSANTIVAKLNSATPTGSKSVSTQDSVLKFDVCADSKDSSPIGKIALTFRSTTSSLNTSGLPVKTINGAGLVQCNKNVTSPVGNITEQDDCYFQNPLVVKAGTCQTLDVTVDTGSFINFKAGVDDLLKVSVQKIYDGNGIEMSVNKLPLLGAELKY